MEYFVTVLGILRGLGGQWVWRYLFVLFCERVSHYVDQGDLPPPVGITSLRHSAWLSLLLLQLAKFVVLF